MKDTFPALYGPIMFKMFEALGGPPHAVTMQSHLWDVSLKFHRSLNERICNSPEGRKAFVNSWAKNATDYMRVVRDMLGPKPLLVWRTGNRRKPPAREICKNYIVDEMNERSVMMTKEVGIERLPYSELLDPPCRDTIHPTPHVTLKYMNNLLKMIAMNVPEVSTTLKKFVDE